MESTITGNSAWTDGGGLVNEASGGATSDRCTFNGNTAAGAAGAIWNMGHLTVTNSTVSGNTTGGGAPTVNATGDIDIVDPATIPTP